MPSNQGRADSQELSKSARRRNAMRNVSLRTSSTASTPTRRRTKDATEAEWRSNNSANAAGAARDRARISLSVLTLGIARSGPKPSRNSSRPSGDNQRDDRRGHRTPAALGNPRTIRARLAPGISRGKHRGHSVCKTDDSTRDLQLGRNVSSAGRCPRCGRSWRQLSLDGRPNSGDKCPKWNSSSSDHTGGRARSCI